MAKRGKKKETKQAIIRKTFQYRCYPNIGTMRRLRKAMRFAVTPVWNACVAEREEARELYKQRLDEAFCVAVMELRRDITEKEEKVIRKQVAATVKWPSAYDQYKHVRKSDHPEYKNYSSTMMQCTVAEVDSSEKSFRSLWINGKKGARPPRQQYIHRCVKFRQSGWSPLDYNGGRLGLSMIGSVAIRYHRPIEGKIKAVSIIEKNRKWYACFSCEINKKSGVCRPVPEVKPGNAGNLRQEYIPSGGRVPEKTGTDNSCSDSRTHMPGGRVPEKAGCAIEIAFGLRDNVFIVDTDGRKIDHPEFYVKCLERLEYLNRKLARRTRWICGDCGKVNEKYKTVKRKKTCLDCGSESVKKHCSKNWYKARDTLRKHHEHIAKKREYWLWHLARYYADNYEKVTIQKWPLSKEIEYAIDGKAAINLIDGAYGKFCQMLKFKCQETGTELIERKDLLWQKQIENLTQKAKTEGLQSILRQARQAVKRNSLARFRYLTTACEQLTMLRI